MSNKKSFLHRESLHEFIIRRIGTRVSVYRNKKKYIRKIKHKNADS